MWNELPCSTILMPLGTEQGRLLFYVKFDGGEACLDKESFDSLFSCDTASNGRHLHPKKGQE